MKAFRIIVVGALCALPLACKTAESEVKKDEATKVAPVAAKAGGSQDAFADGVAAFDAGRYDDARAAFERAVAKDSKLAAAHYNLGMVAERQGRLIDAQKSYEVANQLDPSHRATLLNLGKVYRLQDKFSQAIALYENALKAPGAEHDVALLNNLTVAYRLAKQFDKAEATARRVLARTKDNPDAYKNLALIYFDQGNYRLAEFVSTNAKKLDDKDPGVYNNLGMIYLKMDERRAALAQFQKAVSLSDKFAPGHVNIGAMALQYRDYENAEKSFARAISLDPTSYEAFLAYAWSLDGQKGRDPKKGLAAGDAFEKVLAIKAEQGDAICGAGWAYAAEKTGWEKAVRYLEQCKALPGTAPTDTQLIDAKLKAIASMQKSGQPQPAAKEAPKEKAKASGSSLLDKVSDEAAAKEGESAPATDGAPAGQPAPAAAQPK